MFPHLLIVLDLDRPGATSGALQIVVSSEPVPCRVRLHFEGLLFSIPAGTNLALAGLPRDAGSPALFVSGAFAPATDADANILPGHYDGALLTNTWEAREQVDSPPGKVTPIDLDVRLNNASQAFAARIPALLLPPIVGALPDPIPGGTITLTVTAPTGPTDFSMFPGAVAPASGAFDALDDTYSYHFQAGWPAWKRAILADFGFTPD